MELGPRCAPVPNELGAEFQYPHSSPHLHRAGASPVVPGSLSLHLKGGNTLFIFSGSTGSHSPAHLREPGSQLSSFLIGATCHARFCHVPKIKLVVYLYPPRGGQGVHSRNAWCVPRAWCLRPSERPGEMFRAVPSRETVDWALTVTSCPPSAEVRSLRLSRESHQDRCQSGFPV